MILNFNNEGIIRFLNDIYSNDDAAILSSNDIKEIEKFYKENYKKTDNFAEFLSLNPTVTKKIKKVKGIKVEIERQFKNKKLLQTGTLCECVLAQTIAKMYELDCFADVFHTYIRELPANIVYKLRDDDNKILCRYIYYNKDDTDTFLIQYGNPTRYDADLYVNNQKVRLEFKDKVARAGEKETEYNEEGKLIYTEKFAEENPDYIPLIEKFNSETNMIDLNGNYKDFDEMEKNALLKAYFENLGFEVLVSIDSNNRLIAITEDCIEIEEGPEIISLEGSEIRNSGKNDYAVFTPRLLEKSIEKDDGIIRDDIVIIPHENMDNRSNNGVITGKKINKLFFVRIQNINDENGNYMFSIKSVRQLKPTLCAHMQIIAPRSALVEYYKDILRIDNES